MKSHLLSFLSIFLTVLGLQAQISTVGLIGSATASGWDNDTDMVQSTTDANVWTLTAKLTTGEVKFRANDAWDINWGSKDFPKGTATAGGDNIPVYDGNYTITFNSSTGVYDFDVDSDIGIIGDATPGGWDTDTDMYIDPADSLNYYISMELKVGKVKFRANDGWDVNWGSTSFPNGIGTQGGADIPVSEASKYLIKFNKGTGAYSFEKPAAFTKIGIIGSATPGGWDNDTDLVKDANNPNMWRGDMTLKSGEVKFRADDAWALSWGGTDFPTGKATVGGGNIPVADSARYVLWFNSSTLEYKFIRAEINAIGIIGSGTPGGWDNDTDMTRDSVNSHIWKTNINLTKAEVKFRANDNWDINWGNSTFPNGIATQDGPNTPVLKGNFNVTFNDLTGAYSFDIVSDIGILGDATPGGWDNDTDMYPDEVDSNKYTLTLTLKAGKVKFRKDNTWAVNWGALDFPTGVGIQGGPDIPVAQGGDYYITFDKSTGAYSFTELVAYESIGVIGSAAGGWDNDIDLARSATNGDEWSARIDLVAGEIKFRANNEWVYDWGGTAFPAGVAVAKGANIAVPDAGKYLITFNTKTLAYSFILIKPINTVGIIGDATPGGWDNDTDLTKDANDPDIWRVRLVLKEGEAKFRANDEWDIDWGSGDFPTGVGEQGGANIPIPAGDYKITFNALTGAYTFDPVVEFGKISLVGSCGPFLEWPGSDDSKDTYLTKDPNDANRWTLPSVVLAQYDGTDAANGIKFRAEAAWAINWGAEAFPVGTGTQGGPNIQCNAGTYKIDFKSDTGDYGFSEPSSTYDILADATIHVFPNPTAEFIYIDVKEASLKGITKVNLMDANGKLYYAQEVNTNELIRINVSNFTAGNYYVQLQSEKYMVGKRVIVIK